MTRRNPYRLSGTIGGSSDADLVGKPFALALEMDWPPHGMVGFPVPAGWDLFIESGTDRLRRADGTRGQLPEYLVPMRSPNPNPVRGWGQNGDQLRSFFRDAAAGIILTLTGLNNWSADMIPADLEVEMDGKLLRRAALVSYGLEWRITKIAAAWSGKQNLRECNPALLTQIMELKALRDDLEHAPVQTVHTSATSDGSIYARLLRRAPLRELADAVEAVVQHYSE